MAVLIIQLLGVSIGLLTWCSVSMLTGWAVANFGLFGTKAQRVHGPGAEVPPYIQLQKLTSLTLFLQSDH